MDPHTFRELVGSLDLTEPPKQALWDIIERELIPLSLTAENKNLIQTAYDISYEGHKNAPYRADGNAYITHPVRAAIRMIWRLKALDVSDASLVAEILLHDCFEDAEKAGISPLLMRSEIHLRMGERISYDVFLLTKHSVSGMTNAEYLVRLANCEHWRPLAAKFEDRIDNIDTIKWMPVEKQWAKVIETRKWFSHLADRLRRLIGEETGTGKLSKLFNYLPTILFYDLTTSISREEKRLGIPRP